MTVVLALVRRSRFYRELRRSLPYEPDLREFVVEVLVYAVGGAWSWLRLRAKFLLRRFVLRDSFCKGCGVDVRDFTAPDEIWVRVSPDPDGGDVLCYQCFVERCHKVGLPYLYELRPFK